MRRWIGGKAYFKVKMRPEMAKRWLARKSKKSGLISAKINSNSLLLRRLRALKGGANFFVANDSGGDESPAEHQQGGHRALDIYGDGGGR
jgi:hypothetical protein